MGDGVYRNRDGVGPHGQRGDGICGPVDDLNRVVGVGVGLADVNRVRRRVDCKLLRENFRRGGGQG
jgi:hypothetical protein